MTFFKKQGYYISSPYNKKVYGKPLFKTEDIDINKKANYTKRGETKMSKILILILILIFLIGATVCRKRKCNLSACARCENGHCQDEKRRKQLGYDNCYVDTFK